MAVIRLGPHIQLQYNFINHPANPYNANSYAFSVDDAAGFQSKPGEGLVIAVGGATGLPNDTPVPKPADFNTDFEIRHMLEYGDYRIPAVSAESCPYDRRSYRDKDRSLHCDGAGCGGAKLSDSGQVQSSMAGEERRTIRFQRDDVSKNSDVHLVSERNQ
jgi:hypothetical protein